MLALYQDLPVHIEYRGRVYPLELAFDRVLACLDLQRDPAVPDEKRLLWVAQKLGLPVDKLSAQDLAVMVETVFREYVWFQYRKAPGGGSAVKTFDFQLDADLIYSSFMQAYGIDLIEQQGKLHWWKFYSLFLGLPSGTKMREVMSIRAREIPAPTKHNQKEIRRLRELKQFYALPGVDGGEGYQTGLENLWNALEQQVVKK